jgi:hypothetical protein
MKGQENMSRTALVRSLLLLCTLCALVATPAAAREQAAAPAAAPQAAGDEFWDDRFTMPGTTDSVEDIAVAADGTLYANLQQRVMRWDGQSWQSLGDADGYSIAAIATIDNTLYAAGSFSRIGAFQVKFLAKWNGSAWEQVGSGAGPQIVEEWGTNQGSFDALAAEGGKLYVGGHFTRVDDVDATSITVWDGSNWSALGNGLHSLDFSEQPTEAGEVKVIVPAAGKLYVGGNFQLAGDQSAGSVAVWENGAWKALGSGMLLERDGQTEPGVVYAIAVNGSTVYAGGQFTKAGGTAANNVAAWNGSAWAALGNGITGDSSYNTMVNALVVDGADVLAGGEFTFAGGQAAAHFARWNGTAWQAVGQLESYDNVKALLAIPGGGYYVGGDFNTLDGVLVENIALGVGGSWQALGQGLTFSDNNCCEGKVYATASDDAGHVYVGGSFKHAGGVEVNNIAMWDGSRWQALGAGVGDGQVRALMLLGDDLFVGGTFKSAGGAGTPYLAKWNTVTGEWSGLGSGVNGDVYTFEFADGVLYVGGDMSAAGGVKVSNIAAWDGANWSALSSKLLIREVFDNCSEAGTQVYAIKASGRYLVIGGHFRLVQIGFDQPCLKESYFPANNIVIWDRIEDKWYFLGKDGMYGVSGGDSITPEVDALEIVGGSLEAGGAMYVGGEFGQAGLVPAAGLARYTLAGGWESVGGVSGGTGGALTSPGVSALKAAGSDLYVGGNFTTAGSGAANYIARYNTANGAWTTLGSGVDGKVLAISGTSEGLYLGGEFRHAGGLPAGGFARWGVPISTGNLTSEGGTIEGDGIRISFPAGAVNGNTTILYSPQNAPNHAVPAGQGVIRAFRFEAKSASGQPVTQFAQPYTMQISYDDQLLAAAGVQDPSTLTLVYWNGSAWVNMFPCQGCSVDTTNKVITVVADHFTEFALLGKSSTHTIFLPLTTK